MRNDESEPKNPHEKGSAEWLLWRAQIRRSDLQKAATIVATDVPLLVSVVARLAWAADVMVEDYRLRIFVEQLHNALDKKGNL
jgi:hypothetical protein